MIYLCNHRHIAYESLKLANSLVGKVVSTSEAECQRQRQQQARSAPHSRPRGLEHATREVRLNNKCCHQTVSLRRTKRVCAESLSSKGRRTVKFCMREVCLMLMHRTSPGPHQWDWGGAKPHGRHWGRFWAARAFGTLLHPAHYNPSSRGTPNELFLTFAPAR